MSVIDALVEACGPEQVRLATAVDTVAGIPARWVVAPADSDEVSAVLSAAAVAGLAVFACGAGTKLDWGAPPARVDVLLELGALAGVYDHAPADLVATIGAGTPMRAIRAWLARAGQRLPLDVGSPAATLGGVLATDEAGPLRMTFGTPRDLLVGARFALADGTLGIDPPVANRSAAGAADRPATGNAWSGLAGTAWSGLTGLLCGSFGTLGIITDATVRLRPVPDARAWVVRPVATPREVHEFTAALLSSAHEPVAVEVDLPANVAGATRPGEIAVLVEGSRTGARSAAEAVARLLGGGAGVQDAPPDWWARYPFGPADIALKITAPVGELYAVIYALRDAAGEAVAVRGSAGSGVIYAGLRGGMAPKRVAGTLAAVRMVLQARGGGAGVLLRAPRKVREVVDPVGPVPALDAMWRVKAEFDPDDRLAPGRLPGAR